MRLIAGMLQAKDVYAILFNGEARTDVVELDTEAGWIIRYASEAEVADLIRQGWIPPRDRPMLCKEYGAISIIWEGEKKG